MRKAKPKKRIILPDPRFNDQLVTKFVNNLMLTGQEKASLTRFSTKPSTWFLKELKRMDWKFGRNHLLM